MSKDNGLQTTEISFNDLVTGYRDGTIRMHTKLWITHHTGTGLEGGLFGEDDEIVTTKITFNGAWGQRGYAWIVGLRKGREWSVDRKRITKIVMEIK